MLAEPDHEVGGRGRQARLVDLREVGHAALFERKSGRRGHEHGRKNQGGFHRDTVKKHLLCLGARPNPFLLSKRDEDALPETSKPGIRNYRKPGIASSKRPGIGSQMKWDSLHGGTYRYNPLGLGEIRVLHLLAGKKDDQIHCAFSPIQIRNVNAGNAIPNYHAVSYYWEDKPPLDEIQIFTGTHQFEATYETLVIRPTLSPALRRLRDEQKIVLLWIDALCINQNDDEEKTVQVVMIPQIIYKACHVCVWLGEDANGSETMHTFLPKLLDLAQVDKIVEKESTPEQWQAFSALMMRA